MSTQTGNVPKMISMLIGVALLSGAGLAMAIPIGSEKPANTSHANFWQGFSDGSPKAGWKCSTSRVAENPNLKVRYDWNGSWEAVQIDWNSFAWQTCPNDWAYGYLNQAPADAKRQASAGAMSFEDRWPVKAF
jgi:hypothetical protein